MLLVTTLAFLGCADNTQISVSGGRSLGASSSVGKGTVSSYAKFDKNGAPRAIGIVFQASALDGILTAKRPTSKRSQWKDSRSVRPVLRDLSRPSLDVRLD
jgi:hypothetical protein